MLFVIVSKKSFSCILIDENSNMVTFQMQVKLGCRPMQSQMSSKEIVHAKTEDQNVCSLKSLTTFSD